MADKIKVLIEGMTDKVGGRETYIMTQFESLDRDRFHFDFVYEYPEGEVPERCSAIIMEAGSRIFYLRNRSQWREFLQTCDYDFLILNLMNPESVYFSAELRRYGHFRNVVIHSHIARRYPFSGYERLVRLKRLLALKLKFRGIPCKYWACSDIAGKWMFASAPFEIIRNGIMPHAFERCAALSTVTLPDTVALIDEYAFYQCTALKEITLPASLKNVGAFAFANSGLETLNVPGAVTLEGYADTSFTQADHEVAVYVEEGSWADQNFDSVFSGAFAKNYSN